MTPKHLCWTCDREDICRHRYLFGEFMEADVMEDVFYADGTDDSPIAAGIVVCEHYVATEEAHDE